MKALLLIGVALVAIQYLKKKDSPGGNASGNASADAGGSYSGNSSSNARRTTGGTRINATVLNRLKK